MTDMELLKQSTCFIKIKLELFTNSGLKLTEIQGLLTSLSLSVDADSAIRRTANVSLHNITVDGAIGDLNGLWIDRIVKMHYGIVNSDTGEYVWFLLGTYVLSRNSYRVGIGQQEISLTLIDLMGTATAERGSEIGVDISIPAGSNIRSALESFLTSFMPNTEYNVCNFDSDIPYDIDKNRGGYPQELFDEIVGLYSYYEHFFSRGGVYTVKLLPTSYASLPVLYPEDMSQIVISESGDSEYSDFKNVVEVWGQKLDALYTAETCTSVEETYQLFVADTFEVLEDGMTISFVPDAPNGSAQHIKIQETIAYPLYTARGDGTLLAVPINSMVAGVSYVVKYTEQKYILQGESEIHAICMEFNKEPDDDTKAALKVEYNCENIDYRIAPLSRFACDYGEVGKIKKVLSGGEYDNINTTQLALERARYETWRSVRAKNVKTLTCLFVPWLDVNQKILYTSIIDRSTYQYTVDKIIVNEINGTMTLHISQFYPLYSWTSGQTWGTLVRETWAKMLPRLWESTVGDGSWGAVRTQAWLDNVNISWDAMRGSDGN